jgi:hypothetical protein
VSGNGEENVLHSVVIGRIRILHHATHDNLNENQLEFEFIATKEMLPTASLIVYYIQYSGEIIYDRISLEIEAPLTNEVCIEYLIINF